MLDSDQCILRERSKIKESIWKSKPWETKFSKERRTDVCNEHIEVRFRLRLPKPVKERRVWKNHCQGIIELSVSP